MSEPLSYEELLDSYHDQELLIEIGRDLMRERDTERLLRRILDVSRQITGADAGSIFLAEGIDATPMLRFKYSYTASLDLPYEEFVMPRTTKSIAGYVSLTGKTLNIPDVYHLDPELPFTFNNSFDLANGYRTKSMLTVPMTDHTGAIIGVIQIINSKELELGSRIQADTILLRTPQEFETLVIPFRERYESLMESVAAQAAVALENAAMIKRIESQFEQFVKAAVDAVEERDPATSGHSYRVAQQAVKLALRLNQDDEAAGNPPHFSGAALKELEYAGLLHDFGKVYIDPSVFLKAKKLYPGDYEKLQLRLKYLRRSLELDFAQRRPTLTADEVKILDAERDRTIRELVDITRRIAELNEPSLTNADPEEAIDRILKTQFARSTGIDDEPIPLLTEAEAENLAIKRGSLNRAERAEIERHVTRSYEFVKRIPWPRELEGIPLYVKTHHEMLNGTGYPDGLEADDIPLQGRILAVTDVYDALTASDRPYKKAVPPEKALAILTEEADRGRLDGDLVRLLRDIVQSDSIIIALPE